MVQRRVCLAWRDSPSVLFSDSLSGNMGWNMNVQSEYLTQALQHFRRLMGEAGQSCIFEHTQAPEFGVFLQVFAI